MIKQQEFMEIIIKTARVAIDDKQNICDMQMKTELGIDSILLIGIIVEIEKVINKEISFDKLGQVDVRTPLDLWKLLCVNKEE